MVNNPTFTPYEGFTGDGLTQYINSNYNPAADGVNYQLDSATICTYIRDQILDNSLRALWGVIEPGLGQTQLIPNFNGNIYEQINSLSINITNNNNNIAGMYNASRNLNNEYVYINQVLRLIGGKPVSQIPNSNIFAMCRNNNSVPQAFTINQFSALFIGGYIDDVDYNSLLDAFETYMDSNGKGVIA
jgi:hypothetical protein